MTDRDSVKAKEPPRLVGVIASREGLRIAASLRKPPDLFELRLDRFPAVADVMENAIPRLPSPLIITARDFREGGARRLSLRERRALFLRFLPHAAFVDIELRSLRSLGSIFETAQQRKVQRILSLHDFKTTPDLRTMLARAAEAKSAGAEVFKLVTRVDTAPHLALLIKFMKQRPAGIEVSAMGIGKLGVASRILLFQLGSFMTYACVGTPTLKGQPSLSEARRFVHPPASFVRI